MNLKSLYILLVAILGCLVSVGSLTDLEHQSLSRRVATFVPEGWPVLGRLTSLYGLRRHPIWHSRQFHLGIDIAVPHSTPVHATAEGQVTWSGYKGGYGRSLLIDHGHGWETLYAHLKSSLLKTGAVVKEGEKIGYAGSTGLSTGPHLHYEVHYLGFPQNPLHFTPPPVSSTKWAFPPEAGGGVITGFDSQAIAQL